MAKNPTSPQALNGNPLTTLYDKFNEIAIISKKTANMLIPAPLLLANSFRIWGTFTNNEPATIPYPSDLLRSPLKHSTTSEREMNGNRR